MIGASFSIQRVATDWHALPYDQRKSKLQGDWHGFQRRTLVDGWEIGRGLRAVRDEMNHGEWGPWLEDIGMNRKTAFRLMKLGDAYEMSQIETFGTMDAALKALPPKRPKTEPEPVAEVEPEPTPEPVAPDPAPAHEEDEEEMLQALEAEALEAEAEMRSSELHQRLERLSVRIEGKDQEPLIVLSDKLDRADERHRDDVAAVKRATAREQRWNRERDAIRDALLLATPSTCLQVVDDVLAEHFGVARKQ